MNSGIAYLIIPEEFDKDSYISKCYRTNSISIVFEDGGIRNDVLCSNEVMNKLEFPEDKDSLGSLLIWVNTNIYEKPIVIGTLKKNNDIGESKEHIAQIIKKYKTNVASISFNAKTGDVVINSSSNESNSGNVNINATNNSKNAKVEIIASGDINTKSKNVNLSALNELRLIIKDLSIDNKETKITITKGEGIELIDEFNNKFTINSEGFLFNDGNLGGLVKVNELLTKLNNLENSFNTFVTIYNTHIHTDPITGTTGPSTTPNTQVLTPTILADIENKKVKQ